jgi:tetratricopeptide (TPR) repeat protein
MYSAPEQLGALVPEILRAGPERPEGWIAAAWATAATADHERALVYADRAMSARLGTGSWAVAAAELVRGAAMTALNRPGRGATALRMAFIEWPSLVGLCRLSLCYAAANRPRDALAAANVAVTAEPQNAFALTTYVFYSIFPLSVLPSTHGCRFARALLLTPGPDTVEKARKRLQAALAVDPGFEEAAVRLADLATAEGKLPAALDVLEKTLQHRASARLHAHLGSALLASGQLDRAESHFNTALTFVFQS